MEEGLRESWQLRSMTVLDRGSAASHSYSSSITPQLSLFSLPLLADSSQEAANLPLAAVVSCSSLCRVRGFLPQSWPSTAPWPSSLSSMATLKYSQGDRGQHSLTFSGRSRDLKIGLLTSRAQSPNSWGSGNEDRLHQGSHDRQGKYDLMVHFIITISRLYGNTSQIKV